MAGHDLMRGPSERPSSTAVAALGCLFMPELLNALGTPSDARAFAVAGLWDCVSRIGLRFAGDPFRGRFCERGAKPVQECFAGRVCGERFARERDVR
ncbi:Multidrug export protein MepA [Pandoraea communis]|uniref:Multidrug export protein MepA n=1 Tax=Pandoraea communis TaxID=2508297 RepID=A0A5E4Y8B8_9BURK|nr:Multidrug export protein MepA [Pandoraea communis]